MDLLVPDLDLPGAAQTICAWLVAPGERVYQGDRVLEILAGEVTVDLGAPVAGVLTDQLVAEDEVVTAGQIVGRIAAES